MSVILIMGSGPNVVQCRGWARASFDRIVAINNAWSVRPDWDYHIHPDDFPRARCPVDLAPGQAVVTSADYVPVQNRYGGFVYAGGTMAFTTAYWALSLRPRVIAMIGCDMVYSGAQTHFYGRGAPDPLRDDPTLRNLAAKSARLQIIAAREGVAMVNLSTDPSRLTFPRATPLDAAAQKPVQFNATAVAAALSAEDKLGYLVSSGRYWEQAANFDLDAIDGIDALWLKAAGLPQTAP